MGLDRIILLKTIRPGTKEGKKYAQIVSSVRAIGLVEPPMVIPDQKHPGSYFLLDGHLRIEALRELGINEVECLVSTDDEAYTYNKRLNRLAAVQEHRMITRAVERGVPAERIAEALGLDVVTIHRRFRMLDGICAEAVELLKDTPCPLKVFDLLRQMAPTRQVEAAELMIGQNNFSSMFAKALLIATPEKQLVDPRKRKPSGANAVSSEQIARMERELANLKPSEVNRRQLWTRQFASDRRRRDMSQSSWRMPGSFVGWRRADKNTLASFKRSQSRSIGAAKAAAE